MDADLKAMVDAGNLNVKAAAALDQLKPQTFCLHKSWGFGQISSWNLLLNQIVVDSVDKITTLDSGDSKAGRPHVPSK